MSESGYRAGKGWNLVNKGCSNIMKVRISVMRIRVIRILTV